MMEKKMCIDSDGNNINKIYLDNHRDNKMSSTSQYVKNIDPSPSFIDYLNKKRVKRSNNNLTTTHLSMSNPIGKFCIPQNEMGDFMSLYDREIKNGSSLGIMERPLSHMETPIVCDIDLKYKFSKSDNKKDITELRRHNFNIIKEVVSCYKEVYDKHFIFRNEEDKKNCYYIVTQRDAPYVIDYGDEKYVKDGFHFMTHGYKTYPEIHLEMRKEIIKNENLIKTINSLESLNSIGDVVDEAVINKNAWMMYGSTKPNKDVYKVSHIFDYNLNQVNLNEFKDISFLRYLSYYRNTSNHAVPTNDVRNSYIESFGKNTEQKIEVNQNIIKKEVIKEKKEKKKKKSKIIQIVEAENPENSDESQKIKIEFLVSLLSKKRCAIKELWIEVGECLKNLSVTNYEYYDIWLNFSVKNKKYSEDDCKRLWDTFIKHDVLCLKTLKFWAKKDSPKKYYYFKQNEIRTFLSKCINSTHYDVAQVLYLMYESQYVCVSLKENKWYEFKKHRWHKIEAGFTLRQKVSKEFAKEYDRFRKFAVKLLEDDCKLSGDTEEDIEEFGYDLNEDFFDDFVLDDEEWNNKKDICNEVIVKLKTKGYKDAIMSEMKEFFYDDTFEEKLNERRELVGFENGVFDLDKHIFRVGRPDDYITFTTKTKYIENCSKTPEYKEIKDFYKQVYLTDEMVNYKLKERAYQLHGAIKEEKIHANIGKGGNGKSKERELCVESLGDYCFGFPVTLFTGHRSASNAASPEVVRSKGKRMAFIDEPENNATINIGLIKKFSGGDPIEARGLYADMIEIKPQFKMTLLCNDFPDWPAHDEGGKRRLTITECKAKFVDNPKNANEFKRDRNISKKIKQWAAVYASLLIDYYYVYEEEGLNPPEEVMKFTNSLIRECDAYDSFISDTLVESEEKEDFVQLRDLYNSFRAWIDENGVNPRKIMSFKDFKKYLEKKINKQNVIKKGNIYGYRERLYT